MAEGTTDPLDVYRECCNRTTEHCVRMPDDFNPGKWVTTREAGELTGYTAAYFRQLIQRGRLHDVEKRGRDWFLSKREVLAYAERMRRLGNVKHDPTREARTSDTTETAISYVLKDRHCPRSFWVPPPAG